MSFQKYFSRYGNPRCSSPLKCPFALGISPGFIFSITPWQPGRRCCAGTVLSRDESPLPLPPSPAALRPSPDKLLARLERGYFSSQLHPLAVTKCTGLEEVAVTFLGPPASGHNPGQTR